MPDKNKIICSRLRELRNKAGLEQRELIKLIKEMDNNADMAISTYSSKETGSRKISLNEARLFSKVLSKELNKSFQEVYNYIFLPN
ncbi:helix-turn-helix domain-containing protein [Fuchsiella alkaliacetigena]|uniref:helix-turn-helix domain-containing protein n=1 Tax=Fuchsiella alkaliacetigena TaxID=957042 RepID=UPI00200AFA4E|nr:helix-turn-helix transcriptional regulator [Fuchsiella alkaliacetigena]MCK8826029.1 helix-turn-helix transcriptional regulator [Fuchsiella alkaliacetigena]